MDRSVLLGTKTLVADRYDRVAYFFVRNAKASHNFPLFKIC